MPRSTSVERQALRWRIAADSSALLQQLQLRIPHIYKIPVSYFVVLLRVFAQDLTVVETDKGCRVSTYRSCLTCAGPIRAGHSPYPS